MVSEAELEQMLLDNADRLRTLLTRRIPTAFAGIISAEDLLQEIWIAAFRSRRGFQFDRPNAFDRWLSSLANRKLADACRAARALKRGGGLHRLAPPQATSFVDLFQRLSATTPTPSSEVSIKEASDAVRLALSSLPDDRRRAVWMRFIEGRALDEIAEAMDRTKPAISSLVYNGLRQMRTRLGRSSRFFSDANEEQA